MPNKQIIPVSIILSIMLIGIILAGCSIANNKNTISGNKDVNRTITDMAGREVVIKKEVTKLFSTTPIGTVLVYTLNPDKLAAKNFNLSELEKKYTVKGYHDLPVLGTYIMGDTANEEEIIRVNPDVVLYTGIINEHWKMETEKAQERLGIPIIMVDGSLENSQNAYAFLGELLNEKQRAKDLGEYCENALKEAKTRVSKIPKDKKKKVYYAAGTDGLRTYSADNIHSEIINLAGGVNVVDIKAANGSPQVSIEQLLNWNPDIIIANKQEARGGENEKAVRDRILTNNRIVNLKAVKEKHVYEVPCAPFNWFGQPPSVARILGVKWLGNRLYPEEFNFDIKEEAKEFYKKFYFFTLTDNNLAEIMSNAL
ncbi:MAG: ABC transporter substrate-binding protein [Desulfitobacteriaceae bacterium]|nr:ABC transporter substrate-binding protein [Desulfitobacteriaceae bacterium]